MTYSIEIYYSVKGVEPRLLWCLASKVSIASQAFLNYNDYNDKQTNEQKYDQTSTLENSDLKKQRIKQKQIWQEVDTQRQDKTFPK